MDFSVVMSVYYKDKGKFLNEALESIWDKQTLRPTEIILVEDGKLKDELYRVINSWKIKIGDRIKVIPLDKNQGLAKALNIAILNSKYDIIARMDSDDIATPDRFYKQFKFLSRNRDIDVVGTYLCEIDESGETIKKEVKFPLTHKELYRFFAKRDPMAHPTVMFRRSFFKKAGYYRDDLYLAEDTLLWYYGFLNGCKFANIDYIGLKFRRGNGFYKRRANLKKSISLLKYRIFKINRDLNYGIEADIYAILYFFLSLSPRFVKKILYNKLR